MTRHRALRGPSIALISLLAMSKREPEPLLPVQPQQSAGGTVAVAQAEPQQMVEAAPAQTANPQRGIASYLTGAANDRGVLAQPKKRHKAEPETEQIEHGGQILTRACRRRQGARKGPLHFCEVVPHVFRVFSCARLVLVVGSKQ